MIVPWKMSHWMQFLSWKVLILWTEQRLQGPTLKSRKKRLFSFFSFIFFSLLFCCPLCLCWTPTHIAFLVVWEQDPGWAQTVSVVIPASSQWQRQRLLEQGLRVQMENSEFLVSVLHFLLVWFYRRGKHGHRRIIDFVCLLILYICCYEKYINFSLTLFFARIVQQNYHWVL